MFCDTKVGEEIHANEVLLDRVRVPRAFGFNDADGRRWK
jgi:hypothetical protein